MKIIVFSIAIFLMVFSATYAQDFPASQANSNPFWMCPALVGNSEAPRISSFFRSQWPNLNSNYKTAVLGFDAAVEKVHGGLGGFAIYDNQGNGTFTEWSINGVYSYLGNVNDNLKIRAATQLTLGNKHLNTDNLTFPDQINPQYGFVYNTSSSYTENMNSTYFDLGISVAADFKKLTFGVSGFHLTSPDVGFIAESHIARRFSAFVGYDLWQLKGEKPEGIKVSPLVYITSSFGGYSVLAGSNFSYEYLFVGGHVRFGKSNLDAVIMNAGARLGNFQFGYSYDYTVSKLTNATGGSHEVFLNYFFSTKE